MGSDLCSAKQAKKCKRAPNIWRVATDAINWKGRPEVPSTSHWLNQCCYVGRVSRIQRSTSFSEILLKMGKWELFDYLAKPKVDTSQKSLGSFVIGLLAVVAVVSVGAVYTVQRYRETTSSSQITILDTSQQVNLTVRFNNFAQFRGNNFTINDTIQVDIKQSPLFQILAWANNSFSYNFPSILVVGDTWVGLPKTTGTLKTTHFYVSMIHIVDQTMASGQGEKNIFTYRAAQVDSSAICPPGIVCANVALHPDFTTTEIRIYYRYDVLTLLLSIGGLLSLIMTGANILAMLVRLLRKKRNKKVDPESLVSTAVPLDLQDDSMSAIIIPCK